jgi:hypothetical protein
VVLAEWGLTLLRHWQCCPWVTSLSAEVHDDRRTMSAWRYQSWVRRDSSSAGEMTVVSTANSHVRSLGHITNTRTRPLRQYEPKTRLLLFNTVAKFPGWYPCELPSAPRFNSSAPILQYLSDTPGLAWCTRSTLMPRCTLIHVKRRSHCTIWFTWHLRLGSATFGGLPGRARSQRCSYAL